MKMTIEELIYAREHHIETLMRLRLTELDICLRTLLRLEDAGIKTLGDITMRTASDLCGCRGIGVAALAEIECALSAIGLALRRESTQADEKKSSDNEDNSYRPQGLHRKAPRGRPKKKGR